MTFNILKRNMKHTNFQLHEHDPYGITFELYTLQDAGIYILDIAKDGIDTFKPYKTKRHLERDLYQLFSGTRNCVAGFSALLWTLISTPAFIITYQLKAIPIDIVGGLAQMVRGVIQIVTSPLSLARIPFRYFAFQGIQDENFQDRKSIKQLVKNADDLLQSPNSAAKVSQMRYILDELQRKTITQCSKKQTCYKGKEKIALGVNKFPMFSHITLFTADYYLNKNDATLSFEQEKLICDRLETFRSGPHESTVQLLSSRSLA